jgi:hypothetical protein
MAEILRTFVTNEWDPRTQHRGENNKQKFDNEDFSDRNAVQFPHALAHIYAANHMTNKTSHDISIYFFSLLFTTNIYTSLSPSNHKTPFHGATIL